MKLKEYIEEIEVLGNDIPYQDGVLDILKGNSLINMIILKDDLIGEYDIKDFINRIIDINKKIEIIVILENENNKLNNFFEKKGISKVYIEKSFEFEKLIQDILGKSNNSCSDLYNGEIKNVIKNRKDKKKIINSKVVAICGNYGSGKSLITSILGKTAKKNGIKTIIVDFDIINNSINTIFRVKKYKLYENKGDLAGFITHISNNLDVFCGIDSLFTEENKINFEKVEKLLTDLKEIYDFILIDTSSETTLKYMKIVLSNVDKVIFLFEPNILEMKKAERLLEIYIEDWEINFRKIELILNKVNYKSVDEEIVKETFNRFNIVGKINFSYYFSELANNIRSCDFGLKKYEKILEKIE